ncbi:MAG: electron transfer flavoprotein subunit alpha/FixB family protein [Alphaproteobacteria bacterium]|nr:electron transfer flavoprotein subunit alpha/FixB family protein [Alphaproteobacteria bacterium]
MTTLLIADHNNETLADSTLKAVSAASQMGGDLHILVAGAGAASVADEAAKIEGVAKVLLAEASPLQKQLAEPMADLVVSLAGDYTTIASAASTSGKNFMPRIAALLDCSQISEILSVEDENTFTRPIYAGNAIATVRTSEAKKVITIRTTAFAAAALGGSANVEAVPVPDDSGLSSFLSEELTKSDRPELTSAKIVISGGRGMQSGDNFPMLEKIADRLGAAVGASRAAVDAGFVPNDYQVGQTGKVVAPDLYIAVGISGAIQHLAGMKDSKVIVAINKDEEAPIFQVADYGLVADLFTAIPELDEELEKIGL